MSQEIERQWLSVDRAQKLQHAVRADTSQSKLIFPDPESRKQNLDLLSPKDLTTLKRKVIKSLCQDLTLLGEEEMIERITEELKG